MTPNRPEELTEYSLTELLTPAGRPEEPADFDEFWRGTFEEFGTGPVAWERVRDLDASETHLVTEIRFASSAGEPTVAFLMVPRVATAVRRGLVIGHGYGGRTAPDPDQVPTDTAAIFPAAPGTAPNASSRFPALPDEHVLSGIAHRDTYSHRFAAADVWRAATVLLDAAPAVAGALDFSGGSFGGGIGAMALPWDARFRRASLDVPSFGHHAVRLTRQCTGSGEAVRRHLVEHPEVRPVLGYFDAAVAAQRIRIPVHVAAAVLDPAVDPRGQFAVYHALTGPKRLSVRANGHLDGPVAEVSERMARQHAADFFALPDGRLA
ncbi:acetylxylan esterase [Agromyces cerinus]|uniref:Cephalosporin-C deacetylase n=1 Tax=Agromyces cerinus subsp. cerinus TaxID=232089 RepID=A0A1N6G6D0_9MICO|nr:acetylxylan esterase [Agromyces cerinus]SIO03105.1 cephalosporin-C deacetylase [Agromyces cerinus subsp. cerinus]